MRKNERRQAIENAESILTDLNVRSNFKNNYIKLRKLDDDDDLNLSPA